MKVKVTVLTAIGSFLVCGIVSAGSLWGTFKGNPIIKVNVDGTSVNSTVPAINYSDKVMLPVSMLGDVDGITYNYDSANKTINIYSNANGSSKEKEAQQKANAQYADFFIQISVIGESLNLIPDAIDNFMMNYVSNIASINTTGTYDKQASAEAGVNALKAYNDGINAYNQLLEKSKNFTYDPVVNNILSNYKSALDEFKKMQDNMAKFASTNGKDTSFKDNARYGRKLVSEGRNLAMQRYQAYMAFLK